MILKKNIIEHFSKLIAEAEREIIQKIFDKRLETEPSVTDRFLQAIENVFNSKVRAGKLKFEARTLRDKGTNAPEHKFGADFCGVLNVDLRHFKVTKGFLCQAKMEKRELYIEKLPYGMARLKIQYNREIEKLKDQVRKMLSITPDSFIIIYSVKGFVIIPASSVLGIRGNSELYGKTITSFFREYIKCFIGDHRLKAYDDITLEKIKEDTYSRTAILFKIMEVERLIYSV